MPGGARAGHPGVDHMLEEAIMPIFHTRLTPDRAEQYTRSGHGGGETFYQILQQQATAIQTGGPR